MKFNVGKLHEAASKQEEEQIASAPVNDPNVTTEPENHKEDEALANIDNTLGGADLINVFKDICPITGNVYAKMKNAAADPKNLKLAVVKNGEGDTAAYIEAYELQNFLDASGTPISEAEETIFAAHVDEVPELHNAEFHVVFPSDTIEPLILGGQNCGLDTNEDWAMKLARGCRRYGLLINVGPDGKKEE